MFALFVILASPAQAKDVVHIALAHEWSLPATRDSADFGAKVRADLGYGKGIGIGKIIPEVGVAYAYEQNTVVPRAGVRAILGWVLTPGAYVHANVALGGPFPEPAFGFDAGLSLDVSLPFVRVGGYAGLEVFGGASGPSIPDQNLVAGVELVFSLPLRNDD